ncbi:hypothetical protein Acsp03_34600 [Actinomadura sp. NBRC 104412]|nr:hypothetical protein Acsp03_34600 [Actinomadura sp. NBRC 104412]
MPWSRMIRAASYRVASSGRTRGPAVMTSPILRDTKALQLSRLVRLCGACVSGGTRTRRVTLARTVAGSHSVALYPP